MNGTVVKVNLDRGFGFIAADGESADVFFHISELRNLEFDEQLTGKRVTFEMGETTKGKAAKFVRAA